MAFTRREIYKKNVGCDTEFHPRSVPKRVRTWLRALLETGRIRMERITCRLHYEIYPICSTFYPFLSTFFVLRFNFAHIILWTSIKDILVLMSDPNP